MPRIKTRKGDYHYKLLTIYLGWKPLDKIKAVEKALPFQKDLRPEFV